MVIGHKHNSSAAAGGAEMAARSGWRRRDSKGVTRRGAAANLGALKLTLDDDDRKAIAALPKDWRCVSPGVAPARDAPSLRNG
jgi:2,5-diketo-D-gluconate reductase B